MLSIIKNKLRKAAKKNSVIEKKIREIINLTRNIKQYFHSLRFGFLAKFFPKRHCWLMTKPGGRKETPFKINLDKPFYYNEKLLFLKYFVYNKSDLVARCYDKYLVREYVKECGCEHILNELYGVWDSINDIPWDDLPDEYAMKVTNGCAHHVFKTKKQAADIDLYRKTLKKPTKNRAVIYRSSGDLYALKYPQKVICEKLISNFIVNKGLDDWKFYCMNGEPKYLLYITDRVIPDEVSKGSYNASFMTVDFEERQSFFKNSSGKIPEKPACYEEMLECARKLSKDFPFVRVDFYVCDNKPIFGELTFAPAGSYVLYHVHNKKGLTQMGKDLSLENISEYKKLNLKKAK